MPDGASPPGPTSLAVLTGVAWVAALVLGLALPAILFFFALITAGPVEGNAPNPGSLSGESLLLFVLARVSATAATALIVVLSVVARPFGLKAVLIWVPGVVTAAAALILWDIRP